MPLSEREIAEIAKATGAEIAKVFAGKSIREFGPYINEMKKVDSRIVARFSVIGTKMIVYEVWEPSSLMGRHSTVRTINGEWYGRLGTKSLPYEIDQLPAGSNERLLAVGRWLDQQYEEAYRIILAAYPEAFTGRRSMGTITT